jgi:N-acetylneuraminic acid mutarotase
VLRFDPAKNVWETMTAKPTAVTDVQAALLGEKIYLPGGRQANGRSLAILEVYDPRENTWEQKAPVPVPVSAYALVSFEGRLYLFGGKNGEDYFTSVYIYHPEEDRWSEGSPMESPCAYAGAAVVGGKIHVIGGYDGKHALKLNRAYIPTRDEAGESPWERYAPLDQGRYAMGITNLVSTIYLTGGLDENNQPADPLTLRFVAQVNQWSPFEAPPRKVGAMPALMAAGDFLYVLGGETGNGLSASNQSYQAIYTISVPILQSNDTE